MRSQKLAFTTVAVLLNFGYISCCLQGACNPDNRLCLCDNRHESSPCNIKPNTCHSSTCVHGNCIFNKVNHTCTCNCLDDSAQTTLMKDRIATDCFDVRKKKIGTTSGVYSVMLWKSKQIIDVYCDMETDKGGWTVFQNRFDGSVDFYRNSTEYEEGFGTLNGEFWLGLRYIQEMAEQGKTYLRLDVTAVDGEHVHEVFRNFKLSEAPDYYLKIGKQTVKPLSDNEFGFSLSRGCKFSTYDRDVDKSGVRHCAELYRGGWWYWDCAQANLNGEYMIPPGSKSQYDIGFGGFIYYAFKGTDSLKSSKIMFRRRK
ncbi:fibrinogen-like protein A [Mercenaria mercenaria]|uniref:fibrinogen-like protein A n=1 Tax=Mercenaria mercenaria TaxID=6596 RepID=UPI00234F2034|nr:fibrinogen-like protein A [Mercenaria mercenaria]XP_053388068.1 fibrinogen-like protein A [Mercenaria mercenaria]